jgi:hypothetical protein
MRHPVYSVRYAVVPINSWLLTITLCSSVITTQNTQNTTSFVICLSVRMEQFGSHWTDFHEIWYLSIFRKCVNKIEVSLKSDKKDRYLTWRPVSIFIISRWILLRMKDVSDKSCRENQNTHFVFSNIFFENFVVYEIMWKNLLQTDRLQMTI